jgi:serine/threonine protein kinase
VTDAPRAAASDGAVAQWLSDALRTPAAGRRLGSGYQASVEAYAAPFGDVVVKKPHRSVLLGWLWRYLLRREHAVYARLADVPGVPKTLGLINGEYLALEYVHGPSLREQEWKLADRAGFFAQLLTTLRAMHAAGVAHADLKRKDNIIVAAGERPYLIDFGIAAQRGRSWLGRAWFAHQCQGDLNAWIKLKYGRRIGPDEAAAVLAPDDAALYRPLLVEQIARALRLPWQALTLRRPRQKWRAARAERKRSQR